MTFDSVLITCKNAAWHRTAANQYGVMIGEHLSNSRNLKQAQ
jgi:hypothetical protein